MKYQPRVGSKDVASSAPQRGARRLAATVLVCALAIPLVSAVLTSCVSKGDTVVKDNDSTTRKGGTKCAQVCEKIEEECGLTVPDCEANCITNAEECEGASDVYYSCFLANPLRCGATIKTVSAATCDDESVAVAECQDLRDGVCGDSQCDGVCVDVDGDPVCSAECSQNAECVSGCCAELESGKSVCAFPRFCAPVAVGDPCDQDEECDDVSVCDSVNKFCTTICEQDSECGSNFLGLPNKCIKFDPDDPDTGLCTPTCTQESDCESYSLEEGCVADEAYNYCY